ncbi:MAG: nuclear transport factor 2 family protein [Actinomycetes bacterium]
MTAADVLAVEAVNAEFYEAFEATDYDRMAALWVDGDTSASCVHPGWPVVRGLSQVLRSWAVIFANTPYIQFVLTDVTTDVAGDVAVVTCTENIITSVSTPDSSDGDLGGGRVVATNVFRRTPVGWRMWLHHGSPVLESTEDDEDDEPGQGQP